MSFNTGLSQDGPGLLVRALMKGETPEVETVLSQIARSKPDIAVLQDVDFDAGSVALGLIQSRLTELGHEMRYAFSALPNTGRPTGFDLNRNGYLGDAADKQSFGKFSGQSGMAVLSRYPILPDQTRDMTEFLWKNLPDPQFPKLQGAEYYSVEETAVLRLHTVAAWDVAVQLPRGILRVLTFYASPPVFDGQEDRNGLRNAAELRFWRRYIEGTLPGIAPLQTDRFVLVGGFNNDPSDGEGLKPDLHRLLGHALLQDVQPTGEGGALRGQADHANPPNQDTAQWDDREGLGNLRVDYVLPSARFGIAGSAVEWPATEPEGGFGTRHRPVWVDILW
jgi:hypothetical protein